MIPIKSLLINNGNKHYFINNIIIYHLFTTTTIISNNQTCFHLLFSCHQEKNYFYLDFQYLHQIY